jgi:hypothetical protein
MELNAATPVSEAETQGGILLGEVRALAREVCGTTVSVGARSPASTALVPVAWQEWVRQYMRDVVVADEWPVVVEAWSHASAGRTRELLELDRAWGMRVGMRPLAEASFRAGQRQLSRLRPLRDARVVQRYLAAVESGQAHGWHPVVYGMMLAVFGLPLRQGLVHYADQVLGGFVEGLPHGMGAPELERVRVAEEIRAGLVPALGRLLPAAAPFVVV